MALSRRQFLGAMAGTGLAHVATRAGARTATPDSFLYAQEQKRGFSILQGMTDETSSQFNALLPKSGQWKIEVVAQDNTSQIFPLTIDVIDRDYSEYAVHKIVVEGLALGRDYLLRIWDMRGGLADEREFQALDLSPRAVRFALISCLLDLFHRDDIWAQLDRQDPEMVFFLGDNVYADRTSWVHKGPADARQLWERYVLTRNRVAFYYQRNLRPTLAIWDDHDYGTDNGTRAFAFKDESKMVFDAFFSQDERASLIAGPGIAKRFTAFGADFYLFDNRSFRDVGGSPGGRMLGASQEKWFFSGLSGRPSFLYSGSQYFGAYTGRESFEGQYPDNFARFLARLKEADGVYAFGSGDVHFSEMMDVEKDKLGYASFEIVSSSMHSYTFPGHELRYRNSRRRTSTSAHNFVIFEGEFATDRITSTLTSYSAGGVEFRVAGNLIR